MVAFADFGNIVAISTMAHFVEVIAIAADANFVGVFAIATKILNVPPLKQQSFAISALNYKL